MSTGLRPPPMHIIPNRTSVQETDTVQHHLLGEQQPAAPTWSRRAFLTTALAVAAAVPLSGTAQAHHRPSHGTAGSTTTAAATATVPGPSVLTVTEL